MKYVATLNGHRGEGDALSAAVVDLFGKVAEGGSDEEFEHMAKSLMALAQVSDKMVAKMGPLLDDLGDVIELRDLVNKLPPPAEA